MLTDYRYPGSRSFQDTDLDRKLFFGRDTEKDELLHLILAEKLVVLFAKSGMGKTSLLNAGVLQPLREQGFIPCKIRFNDPKFTPLQAVFTGINDQLAGLKGIEFTPGQETSLWEYFKTAEFWSTDDTLLTPVLILDQFEDFFDFHPTETRRAWITELANLVKGRMPATVKESAEYTDIPPDVKIVIALREDYVGQLDELSRDIPEILDNRFRLTALNRQHAQEAIVKPAQVQDVQITTSGFSYAPEAITSMLDFLCTRKEREKTVATNEVEPFQLQLLCQHIETKMQQQHKHTVQTSDLGGQSGMQKVLQNFYDRQIKRIPLQKRRRVRRLCERGLLTRSNRRLSLEEEDIARRFRIKKLLLNILVNSRLLRAEPRVGSVYYELCHDTLAAPIRKSSRRHKITTRLIIACVTIILMIVGFFLIDVTTRKYTMFKIVQSVLTFPEHIVARGYNQIGNMLTWQQLELEGAEAQYRKAIELYPEYASPYKNLGNVLYNRGQYDEALLYLEKAIALNSKDASIYWVTGNVLRAQEKYDEAIIHYRKALAYNPQNFQAYLNLAQSLLAQGKTTEALSQCQKAIELNPKNADVYIDVGDVLKAQGKYPEAIAQYQQAMELAPKKARAYFSLGVALSDQGHEAEAMVQYRQAIQVEPKNPYAYNQFGMALCKQGKYVEAQIQFQKIIELTPEIAYSYANLGFFLTRQGRYEEAIPQYQRALELYPNSVFAYYWLGNTLKAQGQYAEAIIQYQKVIELKSEWEGDVSRRLGDIAYKQGKTDEAQRYYQNVYDLDEKTYMRSREDIRSKKWFAEESLLVENAVQAFSLANDILKRQLFSPAERLAMRFIVVASLLYQQKRTEALTEFQALFDYYRSLTDYNEKWWDYETLHNVIEMSEKLTDADKTLLLKLIDLLESPKAEGDQKLQEFETALPEMLQP